MTSEPGWEQVIATLADNGMFPELQPDGSYHVYYDDDPDGTGGWTKESIVELYHRDWVKK